MGICPYKKKEGRIMLLAKVRVRLIDKQENAQWNSLMERYHYLANGTMVGPQLRYVAEIGNKAVALIGFSNASLHLRCRDDWIGWNDIQRDRRLGFVAQNSRFLSCPRPTRKTWPRGHSPFARSGSRGTGSMLSATRQRRNSAPAKEISEEAVRLIRHLSFPPRGKGGHPADPVIPPKPIRRTCSRAQGSCGRGGRRGGRPCR